MGTFLAPSSSRRRHRHRHQFCQIRLPPHRTCCAYAQSPNAQPRPSPTLHSTLTHHGCTLAGTRSKSSPARRCRRGSISFVFAHSAASSASRRRSVAVGRASGGAPASPSEPSSVLTSNRGAFSRFAAMTMCAHRGFRDLNMVRPVDYEGRPREFPDGRSQFSTAAPAVPPAAARFLSTLPAAGARVDPARQRLLVPP